MEGYLTTAEAAARLGVTPTRIRQLCLEGRLPCTKAGRDWVIRVEDLEAFQKLPPGRTGRPRTLRGAESHGEATKGSDG
jgi:excisionase family DNA binding protein